MNVSGFVPLTNSKRIKTFDNNACVVCEQRCGRLYSNAGGRGKLKRAAQLKNDEKVIKRIEAAGEDLFSYHITNDCYKNYTRHIPELEVDCMEVDENARGDESDANQSGVGCGDSVDCSVLRSAETVRDNDNQKCIVCNCTRVRYGSGSIHRKLHRICESGRANRLLAACSHFQDTVFMRLADLNCAERVFAAELEVHDNCLNKYIKRYEYEISHAAPTQNPPSRKKAAFLNVKSILEDLLFERRYGLSLSDIKSLVQDQDEDEDESFLLQNSEVKVLLVQAFNDRITFCASIRRNEPLLVFSSEITAEDMTSKMRSSDMMREAGEKIRTILQKLDFGLSDRIGDADELSRSWKSIKIPEDLATFYSTVYNIPKSTLLKTDSAPIPSDDDENEVVDDDEEMRPYHQRLRTKVYCQLQTQYNLVHRGRKPTPLHMMTGHAIYERTKSRELITALNHCNFSTSYTSVKRARNLMAAYAAREATEKCVPLPSHFSSQDWTWAAVDNYDDDDNSSLSGTHATHGSVTVLGQVRGSTAPGKPPISETGLSKRESRLKGQLNSQIVDPVYRPNRKPRLTNHFEVTEDTHSADGFSALQASAAEEFTISAARLGVSSNVSSWGGAHVLITDKSGPLMRIGFAPIIMSPITDYATVRKLLTNLQAVLDQLPNQSILPVWADEGVLCTIHEITLHEPEKFENLFPMAGMFHFAKVGLRCCGRFLTGSGLDDALVESEIFGEKVVQSVIGGTKYVRSFNGMLLIEDALNLMAWKSFWSRFPRELFASDIALLNELKDAMECEDALRCQELFPIAKNSIQALQDQFLDFLSETAQKSQLCAYWEVFKTILGYVKNIVKADRVGDGMWNLHVESVQALMAVFAEMDCVNYLRHGSLYLERIRSMEKQYPELYARMQSGHFSVHDRPGIFTAVSPDMKLEQTINRSQKKMGGIQGNSRRIESTTEWELIYHEVLAISQSYRTLTDSHLGQCDDETHHHLLSSSRTAALHRNVKSLLELMVCDGNVYDSALTFPMYNMMSKRQIAEEIAMRYINLIENGLVTYNQLRQERYVDRTAGPWDTIRRRRLPPLLDSNSNTALIKSKSRKEKEYDAAYRDIAIARERNIAVTEILRYDLTTTCPLIGDDGWTTTPAKSELIRELEANMPAVEQDFNLPTRAEDTAVICDFMAMIHQSKMKTHDNVGEALKAMIRSMDRGRHLYLIFDSYLDDSIKQGERERRADQIEVIEYPGLRATTPVPVQLDKFWPSSANKGQLQAIAHDMALVVSERSSSQIVCTGFQAPGVEMPTVRHKLGITRLLPGFDPVSLEEADLLIIPALFHALAEGCKTLIVESNDTDVVLLVLCYARQLMNEGAIAIWVRFGTGQYMRFMAIHDMLKALGDNAARMLLKVHVLTGCDYTSKIGTKSAALKVEYIAHLSQFAESHSMTADSSESAEKYLVQVWAYSANQACRAKSTFDELREEKYLQGVKIQELPPTSHSIRAHLARCFYVLRRLLTLGTGFDHQVLMPTDYGWTVGDDGIMRPQKALDPFPRENVVVCHCKSRCSHRCKCRRSGQDCTIYCGCKNNKCRETPTPATIEKP